MSAPAPDRRALGRRAIAALACLGVLAHALFLSISIAGMQIGLGVALAALAATRLAGRRVWARSALDLPCLLLPAAAVASLGLGLVAGSPPVGLHEATLWRSILSPIVVLSAIEVGGRLGVETQGGAAGDRPPLARAVALAALATWAVAALLPSAIAWVQYFTGVDPLHLLGLRRDAVHAVVPVYQGRFAAVGFFRWYQRLAHNLIPPLCLAAAVAVSGRVRPRLRAVLLVAVAATSTAVVLTLSRAAWASLVLAAAVLALLDRRLRRFAIPIALALALAMTLHPGVRARLSHLRVAGDNDDRKAIWTVCRAVVADHPLTGVGFGNLPRRSLPYYDRLAPWYPLRAWCHDSFFSAWAEGGPLLCGALAAYWLLLARAFLAWRRSAQDPLGRAAAAGALAALAAMLANSLVHDILYSSEAVYGLGFALAVAAALCRSGAAGQRSSPAAAPVTAAAPPAG